RVRRGASTGPRACRHVGKLLGRRRRRSVLWAGPRHESGCDKALGGPAPLGGWHGSCSCCAPCLPYGIETVACRSSCSLDSSRSRPEAMRHGLPWREVMRAATPVDSAAVAVSACTFREAENSAAASLAGA